uniref:CARD domain-containing protein n=1 Tax=Plectus sambesii TaxID=2011161 RepID=A0A914W7Y0_9BILA
MASSQRAQYTLLFNDQEIKREDSIKKIKGEYPITEEVSKTSAQNSNEKILEKSHEDFEFNDDSQNRKCLISCFPFLCDNLIVDEVIVRLQADYILTQHQADSIRAKETRYEKNQKLVHLIQQCGTEAFSCFMESLTETDQKYIFDKLFEERKAIAERKELSNTFNSHIHGGRVASGSVSGGIVVQGDYYAASQTSFIPPAASPPTSEEWKQMLERPFLAA